MLAADKLETLAAGAQFDVCGYSGPRRPTPSPTQFLYHAALPGGGTVCLFKVLLTNACVNDCAYCVNQVGRDVPRFSFQPEELAKLFIELHQKRLAQGIFLSSAIGPDPSRTMEAMVKTVDILRHRYHFKGYVHLKMLPGASADCIAEGCKLANRVSVNIEAPTAEHLARLTARKDLARGIIGPMRLVKKLAADHPGLVPSGQTTQFVVGAAGETDGDILHATESLYSEVGLRRAYFSAFQPVSRSRLEGVPPTPAMREHRLYQADWLLRVYGFAPREVELALGVEGNLRLDRDPKLIIARNQPRLFPLDVNAASYEDLLRVPGIGPASAKRIVETREENSISSLDQLRKMRVLVKQAAPFIRFKGMVDWEKQLTLMPRLEGEGEEAASVVGTSAGLATPHPGFPPARE